MSSPLMRASASDGDAGRAGGEPGRGGMGLPSGPRLRWCWFLRDLSRPCTTTPGGYMGGGIGGGNRGAAHAQQLWVSGLAIDATWTAREADVRRSMGVGTLWTGAVWPVLSGMLLAESLELPLLPASAALLTPSRLGATIAVPAEPVRVRVRIGSVVGHILPFALIRVQD